MNDRKLLEMAAKAAGVCLHPEDKLHHSYGNWGRDTTCMVCKQDPSDARWNPLNSDRDALRLAVKLHLTLLLEIPRIGIGPAFPGVEMYLGEGEDEYAATRRAIVRAAAEIGEQMP